MALIEVRNLKAWYGGAQILFDVGFDIAPGEVVALLGRNGAGKSTTMKAIMRMVPRIEGGVRLDGEAIEGLATHAIARRGVGYVPEDRRVFTDLDVMENLEVGRLPARDGRAWTPAELFELFPNLGGMRDRPGGQMSGGEQQMLTIARTLMGNPRVILLDEPSEGLAPVIVDAIEVAVQALKRRGVAMLLSEQNLHFARSIADRAVVLERGHVRFDGTLAQLDRDASIREKYLSV
jgi:branched-chain amino acid transport system ATP-binding protein